MKREQGGFTLVEILVALSIFAVLGVAATVLLGQIGDIKSRLEQRATQFAKLQSAHARISRDVRQLVWRPWRDQLGQSRQAVIGGFGQVVLHLTRVGWRNPLGKRRSDLQRVAYWLEGSDLYRVFLVHPDMAPKSEPIRQLLLAGVERLDIEFIDRQGQTVNYWPANEVSDDAGEPEPRQMMAVRIRLEFSTLGEIEWLMPVVWEPRFGGEEDEPQ